MQADKNCSSLNILRTDPSCIAHISFACILACVISMLLLPSRAFAQANGAEGADPVQMIRPVNGSEIIAKKPLIECAISEPFLKESLFVYLDGIDVTGILDVSSTGFSFKPVQILMSGQHQVMVILYAMDGREIQRTFVFYNRHSESFEDLISANEVTARYEGRLEKSDKNLNIPDSRFDANLGSSSLLRKGAWSLSFDTNIRYFEQDLPALEPLEKGASISNYLLSLEKTDNDDFYFLLNLGDVQINESPSTLQNIARRGGRFSVTRKALTLDGFMVKTDPLFNLKSKDDTGLVGSEKDHLKGVSGTVELVKDKALFKLLHITGGGTGTGQGVYTQGGGNEGEVTGGLLRTDFFTQKFKTEMEFYDSSYDADVTDTLAAEDDKAYRVSFSGINGQYNYQAAYEYFGLFYNIPGQAINNDRKGFSLSGGKSAESADVAVSFSGHRNNVDDDSSLPDVYTTSGTLSYNWRKYQQFPVGISYSKTVLKSSDEPVAIAPTQIETQTALFFFSYLKDNLNLTLQPSYAIQNNRLSNDDSTNASIALTTNYSKTNLNIFAALSFNRSKLDAIDEETDNSLANVQIQGRSFNDLLGYGLVGSYNLVEASSGAKTEAYAADFEVAYSIVGHKSINLFNPTIGIRSNYNRTEDHLLNTSNEEWVILLVLTSTLPFTL